MGSAHRPDDRIAKLLKLATNNSNEEEARTAAMKAAALIVEAGGYAPKAPEPAYAKQVATILADQKQRIQALEATLGQREAENAAGRERLKYLENELRWSRTDLLRERTQAQVKVEQQKVQAEIDAKSRPWWSHLFTREESAAAYKKQCKDLF